MSMSIVHIDVDNYISARYQKYGSRNIYYITCKEMNSHGQPGGQVTVVLSLNLGERRSKYKMR